MGILPWEERNDAHSICFRPKIKKKKKKVTLPLYQEKKKNWIEVLPLRSMHSLVLSQCSELPTNCQVTSGCFYAVGPLCALLPPRVPI
uniref:Uncharacterized protein n=1 Tax=Anguilla anguilla TaxID=7936 RepID=A0A0E9XL86_ANGAN